jgi:formylglycine-generating enzyme required for sulfatase activity
LANISISLEGIDQAIANLNYRPNSVKQKAIFAIRAFYTSEESIKQLDSINTDILIKSIWNVGDNLSKIKSKRRNFSSIKSSINTDLEKLSKKEQNSENIIIADSNVFDITEEAKNDLLNSFSDTVKTGDMDLDQAATILKTVADFLEDYHPEDTDTDPGDIANQLKNILDKITKGTLFDGDEGPDEDTEEGDDHNEDVEEIELDEDEELEEIEELDELDEDIEEIEEIEIDEDEELEEIDTDDDIEDIELDEDEELEETEDLDVAEALDGVGEDETLEEADDLDEDVEEIELDEDEELEEIEELDEDIEEIEIDEDEELEEIDELDEDELKALEEFREKKELAEHFDETLGEREKKYNKYVKVPEGKYTIGTKKSIKSSLELQQFDMPEVYISIYPVTNSLFEIFIEETGYVTTAEKLGYGRVYSSRFKKNAMGSTWNKTAGSEDIKGACWHKPFGPDSSLHEKRNHPVVQVSVDDAITFASWIGRRIPTEAEWESAARTDMGYKYPWGNDFNPQAVNIEQSGLSDTSSVDEYDAFANEFKIVDMLGNILEWTSDLETPPIKSKKPMKYCVAKGAAWNTKKDATISSRALFKPGFTSNTIGFRCISEIFL